MIQSEQFYADLHSILKSKRIPVDRIGMIYRSIVILLFGSKDAYVKIQQLNQVNIIQATLLFVKLIAKRIVPKLRWKSCKSLYDIYLKEVNKSLQEKVSTLSAALRNII